MSGAGADIAAAVDWSAFDRDLPPTVYCRCGAAFWAHATRVTHDGRAMTVARYGCPRCASHIDVRRVSHDPYEAVRQR